MHDTSKKILSLKDLARKSAELRAKGKVVVLCHGTFDLLHTGHIRHLQLARKEGDFLMVTVTADRHVNKGPDRPVFKEDMRAENLAALACVDFVALNQAPTAVNVIAEIQPTCYIKGSEYRDEASDVTGNIVHEKSAVESCGGRLVFTDDITFSSTHLLNEYFGLFPPETRKYLKSFHQNYTHQDIVAKIKALSSLKVLVVGDAIIDEYHYVSPLGQSGKGYQLSVKYDSMEQFAGGSLAVANHLAGFLDRITLVTGLGRQNSHEEFIRAKLAPNVEPQFFFQDDTPTVLKRRFVDSDLNKLFEVYFFSENSPSEKFDREVCPWLEQKLDDYDLVIAPDFGNGFISTSMAELLSAKSRFLAVNTQINSGNRGYNVITRYPRADFVSLNEPELRGASHNRHDPVDVLARHMAAKVKASYFAVTQGTKGAKLAAPGEGKTYHVPALSTKVLDRIGAGDAFLTFTSLCLGGRLPADLAIFAGSAAAALDVQIVCNREPVTPGNLFKYIGTLLK
ncbi:MAG: PfkB family carbohydrate kinase [Nitrospinaceae bacterium]